MWLNPGSGVGRKELKGAFRGNALKCTACRDCTSSLVRKPSPCADEAAQQLPLRMANLEVMLTLSLHAAGTAALTLTQAST